MSNSNLNYISGSIIKIKDRKAFRIELKIKSIIKAEK